MNFIIVSIIISGLSYTLAQMYKLLLYKYKRVDYKIFPWVIVLLSTFIPFVNSGLKMLFYGGLKMSFFSGLSLSHA